MEEVAKTHIAWKSESKHLAWAVKLGGESDVWSCIPGYASYSLMLLYTATCLLRIS